MQVCNAWLASWRSEVLFVDVPTAFFLACLAMISVWSSVAEDECSHWEPQSWHGKKPTCLLKNTLLHVTCMPPSGWIPFVSPLATSTAFVTNSASLFAFKVASLEGGHEVILHSWLYWNLRNLDFSWKYSWYFMISNGQPVRLKNNSMQTYP